MSDLNVKLREIRELLENLCKEHKIEFYSNFYLKEDEIPNEIGIYAWYPSKGDC